MKKDKARAGNTKIVLVGGGGHAKVVIDAIRKKGEFDICGIVDPGLKKGTSISGIKVVGKDAELLKIFSGGVKHAFICVGSIGDCGARKRIYNTLKSIGFKIPVIAHPFAVIAEGVSLKEGSFVAAKAVINPGAGIGRNAIINTSSSVDHDCVIGDFVHIAPGAVLSGGVRVGDETHIGTGARITQYVNIGKKCIVGAGTTLRCDMKDREKNYERILSIDTKRRRVFIIAEAGVNHNGRLELAKKMVDRAAAAGADAIKFQTFKAESLVTKNAPKPQYQKAPTDKQRSQFDMIKGLELSEEAHSMLFDYCKKKKIMFLSSPFDLESIDLLKRLGLEIFKVPSGQLTDLPYLRKIGSLKKRLIVSTGAAELDEIKRALDTLVSFGTPKDNITLLHCNTEYPSPYKDANLSAMLAMRDAFGVRVGYSDHTPGIAVPVASAALGAEVIEKHFTLDKNMKGPDHKASLEPDELEAMVAAIRSIEYAVGDGVKRVSSSEKKNRALVRKSIVAKRDIKQNEVFSEKNITTKRPAFGMSPMEWDDVVGRPAPRNFRKDELIIL